MVKAVKVENVLKHMYRSYTHGYIWPSLDFMDLLFKCMKTMLNVSLQTTILMIERIDVKHLWVTNNVVKED